MLTFAASKVSLRVMGKRQARLTKSQRKAKRLERASVGLIAAKVNLAPTIQELVMGCNVTALLLRPSEPYRRRIFVGSGGQTSVSTGAGLGQDMLQTFAPDATITFSGGSRILGSSEPVYLEGGGKIEVLDHAFIADVGRVARLEIAVDEYGGTKSARVSTPEWCVVSTVRAEPTDKFVEQMEHGQLVASALHAETGTAYRVVGEKKEGELGEPTDVLLAETGGGLSRVRLQMQHVSEVMARQLGVAQGAAEVKITLDTIRDAVSKKIMDRSAHDLVLISPAPLGAPFRERLAGEHLGPVGWHHVWLSESGFGATRLAAMTNQVARATVDAPDGGV